MKEFITTFKEAPAHEKALYILGGVMIATVLVIAVYAIGSGSEVNIL